MIDINCLPKNGYGFIYRYLSPNGKSYIGQTTTSLAKRSGKRGKMYFGCPVFYKAIIKYGFQNFQVEILEECEIKLLNEKEQFYINLYDSLIPNGYNVKEDGQNTSRKKNPIYAYNLDGSFYKEYFCQADARRELGIDSSDLSKCMDGKIKFSHGKIWRREYTESVPPVVTGKNGAKPVVQIDSKTNEIINIYPSASAAARAIGQSRPTGISRCCNGYTHISAGYKWQFLQGSTTKDL